MPPCLSRTEASSRSGRIRLLAVRDACGANRMWSPFQAIRRERTDVNPLNGNLKTDRACPHGVAMCRAARARFRKTSCTGARTPWATGQHEAAARPQGRRAAIANDRLSPDATGSVPEQWCYTSRSRLGSNRCWQLGTPAAYARCCLRGTPPRRSTGRSCY